MYTSPIINLRRKAGRLTLRGSAFPGGGWEITSFEPVTLDPAPGIELASGRQSCRDSEGWSQTDRLLLVQTAGSLDHQRVSREVFLFWDSLTRHGPMGHLVRLVSAVYAGETEAIVDGRLQTMAGLVIAAFSSLCSGLRCSQVWARHCF